MSTVTKGLIGLSAMLLAVLAVGFWLGADSASATPGTVNIVAIDGDISGNTPTSIGAIDGCIDGLSLNDTPTIDVVVDSIDPADGISGASFDVVYDNTKIQINSRSAESAVLFFQATPLGSYFDAFSDSLPDTDGDYRHESAEIGGTAESGPGVVARFVIQIVATGVTSIALDDLIGGDGEPNIASFAAANLDVLQVPGGLELHSDGSTCGAATPTPTAPPTQTPEPTEIPTDTPIPTGIPLTATPTPTPKPTCNTTLAANVAVGATTITVVSANGCAAGDTIRIGSGASQEDVKISSVSGTTITLVAGVKKAHNSGETVVEVASAAASPTTTPRTAPSTGDGSGGNGVGSTLLILAAIFGVILALTAGGSLLLARTERKE